MYVSHDRRTNTVFVGDRANDQIFALDDETYAVTGTIPVGAGVFHQWLNSRPRQLWVVNDGDKTLSVINLNDLSVIITIPIPGDLDADGGKPHDVCVADKRAFVSIVGLSGATDAVVQYSTKSFLETGRIHTSLWLGPRYMWRHKAMVWYRAFGPAT